MLEFIFAHLIKDEDVVMEDNKIFDNECTRMKRSESTACFRCKNLNEKLNKLMSKYGWMFGSSKVAELFMIYSDLRPILYEKQKLVVFSKRLSSTTPGIPFFLSSHLLVIFFSSRP